LASKSHSQSLWEKGKKGGRGKVKYQSIKALRRVFKIIKERVPVKYREIVECSGDERFSETNLFARD
jgi:hypothetical protein